MSQNSSLNNTQTMWHERNKCDKGNSKGRKSKRERGENTVEKKDRKEGR